MNTQLIQVIHSLKGTVNLLYDPGVVPLNHAIELEERAPSASQTKLVFAICTFVVLSVLWSALTRVDIVTNARGHVIPSGDLVAVQHLEGGVISGILVSEGQHVNAGQPLLTLATLDTEGRLGQWYAKRAAHLLAIEGQHALTEGRQPGFESVVSGFEAQKAAEISLFAARVQSQETQRTVLTAQLEQRRSEVSRLTGQIRFLKGDVENLSIETEMIQTPQNRWTILPSTHLGSHLQAILNWLVSAMHLFPKHRWCRVPRR